MKRIVVPAQLPRLKQADRELLKIMSSNVDGIGKVADLAINFIAQSTSQEHVDDDVIYVAARELRSAVMPEAIADISKLIKNKTQNSFIKNIFLNGLLGEAAEIKISVAPSKERFDIVLSHLRRRMNNSVEEAISLYSDHLNYTLHTGDASLLISTVINISDALIRSSPPLPGAASAAREMVQNALRWAPWNARLWANWARGYLSDGAKEAAELILWEGHRRLPRAAELKFRLVNILMNQSTRRQEAIKLAKDLAFEEPHDLKRQNLLAKALLATRSAGDRAQAIVILARNLSGRDRSNSFADSTLLGFALAAAADDDDWPVVLLSVFQSLPRDSKILNRIGKAISQQRVPKAAEAYFTEAIKLLPQDTALKNQLVDVLLEKDQPSERLRAIELLRKAHDENAEDRFTAVHLASVLSTGGEDDMAEALAILQSPNLIGNDAAHKVLARIKGTEPQVDISDAVGILPSTDDPVNSSNPVASQAPYLPIYIEKMGNLRRIQSKIEHGDSVEKQKSVLELRDILNEDPTFAYAQLLAARSGVWSSEFNALPSFPAAFELALGASDASTLAQLGRQYPHAYALTLVARAIFGDEQAIREIDASLLKEDATTELAAEIQKEVGTTLRLVVQSFPNISPLARNHIAAKLRDLNESFVGGGKFRLAA